MKRVDLLWGEFIDFDNFRLAAKDASRNKRYKQEVMEFNSKQSLNILELIESLEDGTWQPLPMKEFMIYEPKERVIHAPAYSDRVVHHALYNILLPIYERCFIKDSFACRKGKGTHAASLELRRKLRSAYEVFENRIFVLKADISKYFPSINQNILMQILRDKIKDDKFVSVLEAVITKNPNIPGHKGLPLGSLTSQLLANVYLDQLDHEMKDKLGLKYYMRYMDDFIVLGFDKQELWELKDYVEEFIGTKLDLKLNPKTNVFPINQGIDFVGYRHWLDTVLPRKRNLKATFERLKKFYSKKHSYECRFQYVREQLAAVCGYLKYCRNGYAKDKIIKFLYDHEPDFKYMLPLLKI